MVAQCVKTLKETADLERAGRPSVPQDQIDILSGLLSIDPRWTFRELFVVIVETPRRIRTPPDLSFVNNIWNNQSRSIFEHNWGSSQDPPPKKLNAALLKEWDLSPQACIDTLINNDSSRWRAVDRLEVGSMVASDAKVVFRYRINSEQVVLSLGRSANVVTEHRHLHGIAT
ncbi:hypothetical protein TNCV_682161 [Trichonephila clavipes]|nr:hypothetical protein TNCV_682161 [Trichonephila clavipes]